MTRQGRLRVNALGTIVALVVGAGLAPSRALTFTEQQSPPQQAPDRGLCFEEDGLKDSPGLLRQVSTQFQRCNWGEWDLDPERNPADPSLANQKSCRSTGAADKGQEYAAGLLHATGKTFERCEDGKWVPVKETLSAGTR